MKRIVLVFMAVLCGLTAMAQNDEIKTRRPKYVNLGYVMQEVALESGEILKPKLSVTLNRGRTFYLHRNPIANFLNFGIDATWADVNYSMFDMGEAPKMHQAEIGMQVGPSITFTPVKRLQIHIYGRYAPTFALRYDGDVIGGNYASMFVAGGNLSYSFFGVGVEYRKGSTIYKEFGGGSLSGLLGGGDDEEDLPAELFSTRTAADVTGEGNSLFGSKNVLEGLRIYVTFRF